MCAVRVALDSELTLEQADEMFRELLDQSAELAEMSAEIARIQGATASLLSRLEDLRAALRADADPSGSRTSAAS